MAFVQVLFWHPHVAVAQIVQFWLLGPSITTTLEGAESASQT